MIEKIEFKDTVTVRIAHDNSIHLVYSETIPPPDGQVYVSLKDYSNHTQRKDAEIARLREALEAVFTGSCITDPNVGWLKICEELQQCAGQALKGPDFEEENHDHE